MSVYKFILKNREDFLPPLYAGLAIGFVSIFFIFQGRFGDTEVITKFSIISVLLFLFTHIFSFGNEQSLLASGCRKVENYYCLNSHLFTPVASFVGVFITATCLFRLDFVGDYLTKFISLDKENTILVFSISVCLAASSKTLVAFFIVNGRQGLANQFYLYKSVALGISLLLYSLRAFDFILLIFFVMELICFVLMAITTLIVLSQTRAMFQPYSYDYRYILAGLNIFGYDSLLKLDLILLSIFLPPSSIAPYAIISSVFEGLSQAVSSLQFNYSKFLLNVKNENLEFEKFEFEVTRLFSFGRVLAFLFIPSSMVFLFLVEGVMRLTDLSIVFVLQFSLLFASKPIIAFFTLSLLGHPSYQCAYMFALIIANIAVSYFLFFIMGIIGVAFGSLLVFIAMSIITERVLHSINSLR